MMFYHNSSNQLNDGLVRHLNGWSQVVPISMPWAANTVTSTTTTATPISNPHMMATAEGVNYQPNVMHFTANTSETPINPSLLPYNLQPTVDTLPPKDCPFDVLCPDPCTSQTATRWELLHNMTTNESRRPSHQHLKRRNDSSDEEYDEDGLRRPVKQYISEEKVSAIFNRLHITNNTHMFDMNDKIVDEDFEEETTDQSNDDSNKSPIVFTHELQNAIKNKTMTERLVQNEMDRHSKAVVIWRPNNPLFAIGFNPKSDEEEVPKSGANCDDIKNNHNFIDSDIDFSHRKDEEFCDYDNDMELCQ